MEKIIKAQPIHNKKGYVVGDSIKLQDVCLEPGVKYNITITKL